MLRLLLLAFRRTSLVRALALALPLRNLALLHDLLRDGGPRELHVGGGSAQVDLVVWVLPEAKKRDLGLDRLVLLVELLERELHLLLFRRIYAGRDPLHVAQTVLSENPRS